MKILNKLYWKLSKYGDQRILKVCELKSIILEIINEDEKEKQDKIDEKTIELK